MNRSVAKLLRRTATAEGVFNKHAYKQLKKHWQSKPYSRIMLDNALYQLYLDRKAQEQQNENNV